MDKSARPVAVTSISTDCEPLTRREAEVANLIRAGLTNRAIAEQLCISLDTAKRHSSRIKRKLHLASTSGLACLAFDCQTRALSGLDFLPPHISATERAVLLLLCAGASSKHIARSLDASMRTIDKHRENLLRKCAMHSTRELVAWVASEYAAHMGYVKGGIARPEPTP